MTSMTHDRRSIRLKDYDYSNTGAYFVTVCTLSRACLLGDISKGAMWLNDLGRMVEKWWLELNQKFSSVETDTYVVMPNHFHGIVTVVGADLRVCPGSADRACTGTGQASDTQVSLPRIVQWYKTMTTNEYIRKARFRGRLQFPRKVWQRNYYEHIIRDDPSLNRIREYILTNPTRWGLDRENPDRNGTDEFDLWLRQFRRHQGQDVLQAGK